MTKECKHKFIKIGLCRPNVCVLCGESEPVEEYQFELKLTISGRELTMGKDYTFKDGVITLAKPLS